MRDIDWEGASSPSDPLTLSISLLGLPSQHGSQNSFFLSTFNKLGPAAISFCFAAIMVCVGCLTGVKRS